MKAEDIEAFIASTDNVFTTMLATPVHRGKVSSSTSVFGENVLLAVIGMTGDVRGVLAITYPFETAVRIANAILCTDKTEPDTDVSDAVAEVTNMIAGGSKARLARPDRAPVQLGLPVVIRDTQAHMDFPTAAVVIPFTSDIGEFTLFVSFDQAST